MPPRTPKSRRCVVVGKESCVCCVKDRQGRRIFNMSKYILYLRLVLMRVHTIVMKRRRLVTTLRILIPGHHIRRDWKPLWSFRSLPDWSSRGVRTWTPIPGNRFVGRNDSPGPCQGRIRTHCSKPRDGRTSK